MMCLLSEFAWANQSSIYEDKLHPILDTYIQYVTYYLAGFTKLIIQWQLRLAPLFSFVSNAVPRTRDDSVNSWNQSKNVWENQLVVFEYFCVSKTDSIRFSWLSFYNLPDLCSSGKQSTCKRKKGLNGFLDDMKVFFLFTGYNLFRIVVLILMMVVRIVVCNFRVSCPDCCWYFETV